MDDILGQVIKLSEINIPEIAGIQRAGDTIFDLYPGFFRLIGPEDPVPDIEQVAEVGVHVQGVAGMVNPVMDRCKDNILKEAHPAVFEEIFHDMNKGAPGAIDQHDEEQQGWIDTCKNADGCSDHIRIGCFQEEMGIGDGQVHGLRCMMGGMQAPEQTYLMPKVMIYEMGKLPYNIPIYKPIPGESRF